MTKIPVTISDARHHFILQLRMVILKFAKLIIEEADDKNPRNTLGETPLHFVARMLHHTEVLKCQI